MRQGNDVGTTYRSAIYTYRQQQLEEALASKERYQQVLFPPSGDYTSQHASALETASSILYFLQSCAERNDLRDSNRFVMKRFLQ